MFMLKTAALAAALAAAFAASPVLARDGTYTTTKFGRIGDVTVETVIKDGKIASVKVLDWSETHPVADLSREKIPAEIVKNQSVRIDAVSGATLSSFAIAGAVREAIKEAGLDVADFSKAVEKPALQTGTVEESADLIVIGAGGAGLSAAVAAAQQGKRVIVMEKAHFIGGNTSVAGGAYNAADPVAEANSKATMTPVRRKMVEDILAEPVRNDLHKTLIDKVKKQLADYDASKSELLFDSPELHALQSWKGGDYVANLELVYRLTQEAPKMQKTLASIGFKWRDFTDQVVGALWPRSNRASNYKSGVGFIDTFLDEIRRENLPVTFVMNTRATNLIMKDGRVVGVEGKNADGKTWRLTGKDGVILATGGFGASVEKRLEYDELWDKKLGKDVNTTNVQTITGDGIELAKAAGADFVDMGLIQLLPITDPYTGAVNHTVSLTSGIYVNSEGNRFINEMGRRDELSIAALRQPGQRFFILATSDVNMIDAQGRNQFGIRVSDLIATKKVFKGDTWDDLAKAAGINAENLKKTVAAWNAFCKKPENDPFGRPACDPGVRLDGKGPYYAAVCSPSVHHTMGGVRIDVDARVIDTKGKPIPGLYAAGEVTGGIHGKNRIGGNAVPDALVFGRIAGLSAAGK